MTCEHDARSRQLPRLLAGLRSDRRLRIEDVRAALANRGLCVASCTVYRWFAMDRNHCVPSLGQLALLLDVLEVSPELSVRALRLAAEDLLSPRPPPTSVRGATEPPAA